jgi:imidazole glycerol phosphate synthase glutamine amidotransferase subunit
MIAILDSGAGNLQSALNALKKVGVDGRLIAEPELLARADKVLFPGVGSWGAVMSRLHQKGFCDALRDLVATGKPYFGICMGLQVLFSESEEDEGEGLCIFPGRVVRFKTPKVPQIGWNLATGGEREMIPTAYFYFINSYHVKPADETIVASKATYMGEEFVAAVRRENVTAVQFHPEKSAHEGLELLRRWALS